MLTLTLALLVGVRGVGASLVCDAAASLGATPEASSHAARHVDDMAGMASTAPADESHRKDGCDAPERARECGLMAACAPALSEPGPDTGVPPVPDALGPDRPCRTLPAVDRSPEPPPPRS